MDKEMEQFQKDLLDSVRQMKAGKGARKTQVALSPIAEARSRLGMSQSELADLMGVSTRTLQDWEQGRRKPTGAAQTLLRVAIAHPEALLDLKAALWCGGSIIRALDMRCCKTSYLTPELCSLTLCVLLQD